MTLFQKLISIYAAYSSFTSTGSYAAKSTSVIVPFQTSFPENVVYSPKPLLFKRQQLSYTLYTNDFKEIYHDKNAFELCNWANENKGNREKRCLVVKVDLADGTSRFYNYLDFCKISLSPDSKDLEDFPLPLEFDIEKYCTNDRVKI